MSIYLKHLGFQLLFTNINGRRCVPEALAQASRVTRSLAFLKFAAYVLPAEFKDEEGVRRHHNPVSSAL